MGPNPIHRYSMNPKPDRTPEAPTHPFWLSPVQARPGAEMLEPTRKRQPIVETRLLKHVLGQEYKTGVTAEQGYSE